MLLLAALLAGCGQKGPLVLPGEVEPPLGQTPLPQIPSGDEQPDADENENDNDNENADPNVGEGDGG